jgi:hypothetical protein
MHDRLVGDRNKQKSSNPKEQEAFIQSYVATRVCETNSNCQGSTNPGDKSHEFGEQYPVTNTLSTKSRSESF